jgi:hypothetical protein
MKWNEVLNTSFIKWHDGIVGARECALLAGYPYFAWNNIIYHSSGIPTAYIVDGNENIVISVVRTIPGE